MHSMPALVQREHGLLSSHASFFPRQAAHAFGMRRFFAAGPASILKDGGSNGRHIQTRQSGKAVQFCLRFLLKDEATLASLPRALPLSLAWGDDTSSLFYDKAMATIHGGQQHYSLNNIESSVGSTQLLIDTALHYRGRKGNETDPSHSQGGSDIHIDRRVRRRH
jgi:hypothetical protein